MAKNKTILFIPPVHWNYYPYRDQELPTVFAQKGYQCIYLNPVKYKGSEKATRFAYVNDREIPVGMHVINRTSNLSKSVFLFFFENYLNYKTVKQKKPDAVISSDHLMALFTCIYCRMKHIKFIFDVTDNWELVDKSIGGKFYKYLIKPLFSWFAYAVTSTSFTQFDYFSTHRKNNTVLIPNGISPTLLQILKETEDISSTEKKVNFIGSLRDWYDFDLLFEVFRKFPEITLNIYGQGPLLDDLKEKSLREKNIKIHGNVDSKLLPHLLRETLFGVIPLKMNELNDSTCPIKLFDYWGAEKAVIASPTRELRRIGEDALLYSSNKMEFINNIRILMKNRDLLEKFGKMGYEKIEKIYNYDAISSLFIELIES